MSSPAYELARCLVCGTADGREVVDGDALREEVEALWAFQTRRLRATTPAEHLTDRLAFSQHAPLRLVRCPTCGLVYRNPVFRCVSCNAASTVAGVGCP